MDINDLSNLLCDLTDIRNILPDEVKAMPKDNEGTEFTIGDLLDDAIDTLEAELNYLPVTNLWKEKQHDDHDR